MRTERECSYREEQEHIVYCNKDKSECKYQSRYNIPYSINGRVGGRKYECKKT